MYSCNNKIENSRKEKKEERKSQGRKMEKIKEEGYNRTSRSRAWQHV
jgi:hypothetical protein